MSVATVASAWVLSLRTPFGARETLRAVGGPPLRATPTQFPCSVWAEGWRGGEVSTARTAREHGGGPQRPDPAACTEMAALSVCGQ